MKFIKSTLALGLLLVAPAGLTFWVLVVVIRFFDQAVEPFNSRHFPGMGLVFAFIVLFTVGLLGKTFLGRVLKSFFDWILEHLPFVRNIYRLFNQISDAFFSKDSKSTFKQVVMVPFGAPEARSIGFLVKELGEDIVVFVPAAPNPTSGFILKIPRASVTEVQMSVEDAFKVILSCGALLDTKTL